MQECFPARADICLEGVLLECHVVASFWEKKHIFGFVMNEIAK